MSKQLDLFDREAGKRARKRGIDRAEKGAGDEWMAAALDAIHSLARERPCFTAEALWARVARPREPRAAGAAFRRADALGWIEPTERTLATDRVVAHRRPQRVWRSLLCAASAASPYVLGLGS